MKGFELEEALYCMVSLQGMKMDNLKNVSVMISMIS